MLAENFKEILKNSLSLDHIYILYLIQHNYPVFETIAEDTKVKSYCRGLVRKNYTFTDGGVIYCTATGIELANMWDSTNAAPIVNKDKTGEFDKWWNTYPGNDTFTFENKTFKGSRGLRVRREECRLKFEQILMQGTYSTEQMIAALEIEVEQKKSASVKSGVNKLSYMQNSLTYLNQRTFESFMDLIGKKVIKKQTEISI